MRPHSRNAPATKSLMSRRYSRANLLTPFLDFGFDDISHLAGLGQLFLVRTFEAGRVGEAPMQPLGNARKYRAALGAGFVTDCDDVREHLSGLEHVEHRFGFVA